MSNLLKKIIPKSLVITLYKILPLSTSAKKKIIWFANKKFLVAVLGIILNNKGEVLLLKHTYRNLPWGLPGGWMEYEQPENAIQREIAEETGLRIKANQVVRVVYGSNPYRVDLIIKGKFVDGKFRPSYEVSEYGFFKAGNWPSGMPNTQKELIENILRES